MTYLHCQCGSTQWQITAKFNVGFTVPTLSFESWTAFDAEHSDREPKCAECGAPMPSYEDLQARKAINPKRHPGLPMESAK